MMSGQSVYCSVMQRYKIGHKGRYHRRRRQFASTRKPSRHARRQVREARQRDERKMARFYDGGLEYGEGLGHD